jgi:cardiolipin synthase
MVHAGTIATIATVVMQVGAVHGGDHAPRELPPYAVQPPGASFERTVDRRQYLRMIRETLRATCDEFALAPLRSLEISSARLAERIGTRIAGCVPHSPVPPGHQCQEAGGPCTPARLTMLYDSRPAYEALLALIASARCRIDLMMFGWGDDPAGRPVAAALIERARAGVLVRVMIDRGGFVIGETNAHVIVGGEPSFLDALGAEPNVRLIQTPDQGFRFDHRKLAVIDDRVAWSGSLILTKPSVERWHNVNYIAEGPIVAQLDAIFAERWESLGGCRAPVCTPAPIADDIIPNAMVRIVRTDVDPPIRTLKEAVYGAVDTARLHIYLENPYFDDQILIKKLVAARARGVDVRAILTMRGDVKTMNKFAALTANALLRGGARVYLYPAMTHVKAMAVDGTMAYIGTGNYDDLSLRNNREVSLTVRGPEIVPEIEEDLFLRDMAVSEELHALLPLTRGWFLLRGRWEFY